jgi:predicted nucleic acid-binding protein
LHAVNWVELRYLERREQLPVGDPLRQFMEVVGVELSTELSPAYLERAADLKARYPPIALGDCFAVALAQTLSATLITTDRNELQKVADAGTCAIVFLR